MMDEIYTCICGGQTWIIGDGVITCDKCGKDYDLKYVGGSIPYVLDKPKDFNERIKKET